MALDLDPYVKKLLNARRRVVLVNNILQNAQVKEFPANRDPLEVLRAFSFSRGDYESLILVVGKGSCQPVSAIIDLLILRTPSQLPSFMFFHTVADLHQDRASPAVFSAGS